MVLRRYKSSVVPVTIASDAHRSGKLAGLTSHLLAQVNALGLTPCYFRAKTVICHTVDSSHQLKKVKKNH